MNRCSCTTAASIGRRHARKHPGLGARGSGGNNRSCPIVAESFRERVLTEDEPSAVLRLLTDSYAAFGDSEKARHEPAAGISLHIPGTSDAVLDALPHPVVMVSPDGAIASANAAAEPFFEASLPLLRRHKLRELVPFGLPCLHSLSRYACAALR